MLTNLRINKLLKIQIIILHSYFIDSTMHITRSPLASTRFIDALKTTVTPTLTELFSLQHL